MEVTSRVASCLFCKNLAKGWKCEAFPEGIPDDILSGENDHTKPLPNQTNNTVFEPID